MLYIKADGSDLAFFKSLEDRYEYILVSDSKNFDGSAELVEVFIPLSPIILSSLTVVLTEVLSYMKSKHSDNSKKMTEIQIERKTASGEYKVIVKSSEVNDISKTFEKVMRQIKKDG